MTKENKKSGKVKPSREMGYVSSVEEARKKLEDLYNLKENSRKANRLPIKPNKGILLVIRYVVVSHKSVL